MNRILLIDDDVELCEMLGEYLANEGFSVDAAHDGERGLELARSGGYDLLVLDVMMPKRGGLDVLRELRPGSPLPVLMLTARGEDVDSIVGLELGADDYLAKPANPRVLLARLRALLRRAGEGASQRRAADDPVDIELDGLHLQPGSRRVLRDGVAVELTSTEFSVLEVLLREAGRVVTKADLSERALGRELGRYDRSIDVHVGNLRKKLGPSTAGSDRIKTVRGVGYLYVAHP